MMKRTFSALLALLLSLNFAYAQSNLTEQLAENIKELTLQQKVETPELKKAFIETSENGRYNDLMILQLFTEVNIDDAEIQSWMDTQLNDGSWSDVDYKDNKRSRWEPAYHTTRIQAMVKVFKSGSSELCGAPALSSAIHKAMDFWAKAGLRCPNWWYNQIGVPKMMAPAYLLFWDEMSDSEKIAAIKVLDNAKFGMTGQNKVWLAGIVLIKALLIDDETLVKEAREQIASEIFMTTNEGLQPDYSFHQHGAMMQFGNYGLAYISSMAYWARIFNGTSLAFGNDQMELLRNYMSQGIMWCVWRGYFDPSASGRQVFLDSQKGKGFSMDVSAINMREVDIANQMLYTSFLERNLYNPSTGNDLVGNKYYYRSDYGVHRTPEWFASVRMHSNRTLGYEIGNGENLKGFYSSDGATIVMVDGGEYDNIYPVWDWRHLPGTTVTITENDKLSTPKTAMMSVSAKKSDMNTSSFVGGVSDGEKGCMTMEIMRDSLKARKSYFFIDNSLVCLGNSITTMRKGVSVHTTIDQAHLKGVVLTGKGKAGEWIHHDKKGYVIFDKANPTSELIVTQQKQFGDWHDIAVMYNNMPREADVFTAYLNHGNDIREGGYAYAVLPNRTAIQTAAYVKQPGVKIISNTPQCQAVISADGLQLMAIFYEATEVNLPGLKGSGNNMRYRKFGVDRPCVVTATFTRSGTVVLEHSIASPGGESDVIGINYQWSDKEIKHDQKYPHSIDWTVRLDNSPQGRGSSVVIDKNSGH